MDKKAKLVKKQREEESKKFNLKEFFINESS